MPYQGRLPYTYKSPFNTTLDQGTQTVPSLAFLGDTNNGLFSPATDNVAITTNGVERLRVTDVGNVGIGNTNPPSTLTIGSSIGGGYALTANSTSQYGFIVQTSDSSAGNAAAFWVRTTPNSGTTINTLLRCENNGLFRPGSDATQDLGSPSYRWANIYSADLQLSNEGSSNDVDGTWGAYTIQEGENDLYLLNRRNGKKYKFVLQEVN